MKMPRVTVSRLEAESSLAEVDLPGDAGADHPLQSAIYRGTGDTRRLAADALEEIVRADVSLLAEKHIQDAIAFAGALTARGAEAGEIRKLAIHVANWWVGELATEFTNSPRHQPAKFTCVSRPRRTVRSRKSTSPAGS